MTHLTPSTLRAQFYGEGGDAIHAEDADIILVRIAEYGGEASTRDLTSDFEEMSRSDVAYRCNNALIPEGYLKKESGGFDEETNQVCPNIYRLTPLGRRVIDEFLADEWHVLQDPRLTEHTYDGSGPSPIYNLRRDLERLELRVDEGVLEDVKRMEANIQGIIGRQTEILDRLDELEANQW